MKYWYEREIPMGRRVCPECRRRKFTYYVDAVTKKPFADHVGACYRAHSCGYDYTPIAFREDGGTVPDHRDRMIIPAPPAPLPGYRVPFGYVQESMKDAGDNAFLAFLRSKFPSAAVDRMIEEYAIGTCTIPGVFHGAPIFWQVDHRGQVRGGKVRQYDAEGHGGATSWHHVIALGLYADKMEAKGVRLDQCLFGLHLASKYPSARIAIVEAEKTAIVGRIAMPDMIWMATGGKDGLTISRMMPLKGRDVLIIPDMDAYDGWKDRAEDLDPLFPDGKLIVADLLQCMARPGDEKADFADFVLSGRITTEALINKEQSQSIK